MLSDNYVNVQYSTKRADQQQIKNQIMKVKYCDRITIKGLMRISGRRKKQAVECLKGDRSGKDGGLGVNVSFITRVTGNE